MIEDLVALGSGCVKRWWQTTAIVSVDRYGREQILTPLLTDEVDRSTRVGKVVVTSDWPLRHENSRRHLRFIILLGLASSMFALVYVLSCLLSSIRLGVVARAFLLGSLTCLPFRVLALPNLLSSPGRLF